MEMKAGDLVDFEFEDIYTGLVVSMDGVHIKVLFQDARIQPALQTYTYEDLEMCWWEVINESG